MATLASRGRSTPIPIPKVKDESLEVTVEELSSVSSSSTYARTDSISSTDEPLTPFTSNLTSYSSTPDVKTQKSPESDPWSTYYPHPVAFKIGEHPIDQIRELKVAVVGGGISGISAGALLPIKVPGIQLTIFEKNSDVGGTWQENRYPGIRCDIPAHSYQSSFSPNTQWTEEYAQGPEIRKYWQSVARKYDVYSKLRLSTKVVGSYWEPQRAQWRIESESNGERKTEYFDFVINAIGRFNSWRMPKYPGMEKYKGHLCHSSNWDESFDGTGKRIATIGNGASGVQVTTALQKVAARIDHYARNPTWISSAFTPYLKERQDRPMTISQEQRESFKDGATYLKYRKNLEDGFWRTYSAQLSNSETSKALPAKLIKLMRERVGEDENPELADKVVPNFPPHCRRLTPAPGYLEALIKDNVEYIQTPIERFTEEGIVTKDGVERKVDAVICSTGANTDCAPPTPIVSGDYDLSRDWKPDGKFGFPYSYLGVGVPGFPNMSFILGPNPAGPTGTLVNSAETQIAYIAKVLRKISSQGIKTMMPSKEAADDFVEYCDAYFPRTNLTKHCSSWSNGGVPGARIHGHWPGSASHLNYVRREPRWEDFEYTYVRSQNRFAYFGNGCTQAERDPERDMTPYLKLDENNDLRDLHERWYEL